MTSSTATRSHRYDRNLRRTASSVGAAGIVVGAGVMAIGLSSPAQAATSSVKYSCTATAFGATLDQGTWTATVQTDLPAQVNVGQAIPAPSIKATVTTSDDSANTLRALGTKSITGTSAAGYSVGSAARTANLTIPTTQVPASGPIITTATGTGAAETAPDTPGTLAVKVGNFTGSLTTDNNFTLGIACTLQPGQDTTIASIAVVNPATSTTTTSPTSTATAPPTSTSSPTAPPTSTTSSTSSTSTTTSAPPTSTPPRNGPPTSGPVTPTTVQTGSVATSTDLGPLVAVGAGMATLGVVTVGGGLLMSRRRDQD